MSVQIPLSRQLRAAAFVWQAVCAGRSWQTVQHDIEPALRPGVQAIAFACLRRLLLATQLRTQLVSRTPAPTVDALLCCALALLAAQEDQGAAEREAVRYDPHTLVNQAVQALRGRQSSRSEQAAAGFVNACLRRFLRERQAQLARAGAQASVRAGHPAWWIERVQQDWGEQMPAILQANLTPAPLTLRISEQKQVFARMESALNAMNLIVSRVASSGLQLSGAAAVQVLPGYEAGEFAVQDAAAQLAAPLLLSPWTGVAPTEKAPQALRVLDSCAAPGGKTAHLLDHAAAHGLPLKVTALEVDAQRAERIRENLARLGGEADIRVADANDVPSWHDGQPFDAILLDAPCTASGIVRRHPDILWLRRESDVAQLVAQQRELLLALWPLVKPGGYLLYCTCSVFKAEGSEQIDWFAQSSAVRNTGLSLEASPGHLLPQSTLSAHGMADNSLGEHDGFFYALLRKPQQAP
jgi:16S rRNA (cytosine967-C5)-methyltransferase